MLPPVFAIAMVLKMLNPWSIMCRHTIYTDVVFTAFVAQVAHQNSVHIFVTDVNYPVSQFHTTSVEH